MTISKTTIKKLQENYENLGILEAINAFYQIRGIVTQESLKHSCCIEEAFLDLHQRLFALIKEHFQEEDLKVNSLKRIINLIEADMRQIINYADSILLTLSNTKSLLFPLQNQTPIPRALKKKT